MVTVAVEPSIVNASVQLGPLMTGLGLAAGEGFGLRSGGAGVYDTEEVNLFYGGYKAFNPTEFDQQRGKGYEFRYGGPYLKRQTPEGLWFNWLQFEVALGFVVGVRAGLNLAEITDFVLGWTTLDICGDDIATIIQEEQSDNNRPSDHLQSPAQRCLKCGMLLSSPWISQIRKQGRQVCCN